MANIFKILSGLILFSCSLFSQWYNVSPPGNDSSFFCIEVVTGNVVYAGKGSHGIMVKTTNGGTSWSEVNTPCQLEHVNHRRIPGPVLCI